jgi:hypothetical protein
MLKASKQAETISMTYLSNTALAQDQQAGGHQVLYEGIGYEKVFS